MSTSRNLQFEIEKLQSKITAIKSAMSLIQLVQSRPEQYTAPFNLSLQDAQQALHTRIENEKKKFTETANARIRNAKKDLIVEISKKNEEAKRILKNFPELANMTLELLIDENKKIDIEQSILNQKEINSYEDAATEKPLEELFYQLDTAILDLIKFKSDEKHLKAGNFGSIVNYANSIIDEFAELKSESRFDEKMAKLKELNETIQDYHHYYQVDAKPFTLENAFVSHLEKILNAFPSDEQLKEIDNMLKITKRGP